MAYNVVTQVEVRQMIDLYASGLSSNDVGLRVGRDGRLVRTHLKAAGVLRERTEAVRQAADSFERWDLFATWTPESSWVLGLLFGDGHLATAHNQFTLCGTSDVCRAVSKILGVSNKIVLRENYALLKWSSWRMAAQVRAVFGIGGNKAKTMRFPKVPLNALPHFVRGLWDADGGWQVRGRSLRANYACSSEDFLDVLRGHLWVRGWDPRKSTHTTRLNGKTFTGFRLQLVAADSRALASWLYEGSTSDTRCARKFGKAFDKIGAQ